MNDSVGLLLLIIIRLEITWNDKRVTYTI